MMIIYKTTNLVNGNFYIGQDSKNDINYLGSGKLLKRAIQKHGRDNFQKEILEFCKTKKELNEREIYWIAELEPIYNIANGGSGGDTLTNHPDLDLIKEKLKGRVSYHKGKKRPYQTGDKNPAKRPEVKEKIRQAKMENPTQMFGDDNPAKRPEVKEKISQALKGKPKQKIKCPYCEKEGQPSNMYRWHNDKCKFKPKK